MCNSQFLWFLSNICDFHAKLQSFKILIKIVLRDLKEVLDEVIVNDIVEYQCLIINNKWEIEIKNFISDRLLTKISEYNQKKMFNDKGLMSDEKEEEEDSENEEEDTLTTKKFKPIEISENGLELIELISIDCTASAYRWTSDYEIKIDKNGYLINNGKKTKEFWNSKIICDKKPLRMKIRNIAGDETTVEF